MTTDTEALPPLPDRLKAEAMAIFNDPPSMTPQEVRDVIEWYDAALRAALAQRQQVPMAQAMNIAGAASLPPSVGSGWVAACGCGGSEKYVDGKLVRSEYKCAAHAAAPALTAAPQAAEPTRSQKMRAAGFTARDKRLTCDECGAKFTAQFAPLHECAPQAAEPAQDPPLVALKIIGCVPSGMERDPGIAALARMAESITAFKDGKRVIAVWDHAAMFDVRDRLCELAAPQAAQAQPAINGDVVWLWTHCRALGMTRKSESGTMRDDVALFVQDLHYEAAQAQPQEPPRSAPLTEKQIADIVREASRGSAIRRNGSTSLRIARAIERAHGIVPKKADT